MIARRIVTIVYEAGGVTIFFKTPASEARIVHTSKSSERIPEHVSLYMDNAKIEIIEKDD